MKVSAMNKIIFAGCAARTETQGANSAPYSLIFCIISILVLMSGASPAAESTPLRPGEKLQYKVYWTTIEAADVTLQILPMEKLNGTPVYHFVMTAATSPLVENIYPVHDRIDSYADAAMSHALLYKERKETRKIKDVSITFDWQTQKVIYSKKGKKRAPKPLLPGAFDPLSVFYFFRTHELKENMEISRPVSDGKVCVIGKARVRSRQKVQAAGREYDTYLVEPELGQLGGVFEKNPDAKLQIWVTADKRRLPVMIKSEVAVGSFTAELVGIE
jgi:hypothetical protein